MLGGPGAGQPQRRRALPHRTTDKPPREVRFVGRRFPDSRHESFLHRHGSHLGAAQGRRVSIVGLPRSASPLGVEVRQGTCLARHAKPSQKGKLVSRLRWSSLQCGRVIRASCQSGRTSACRRRSRLSHSGGVGVRTRSSIPRNTDQREKGPLVSKVRPCASRSVSQ